MKKRLLSIIMVMVLMMATAGCGSKSDVKEVSAQAGEAVSTDSRDADAETENTSATEASEPMENTDTAVNNKDSLNLEEYVYTFEDRSAEKEGKSVFYLAEFSPNYQKYYLLDNLDIYAYNGACIGYIKAGTEINMIGQKDEWGYLSIEKNTRFIKIAEAEEVSYLGTKREYLASLNPKTETPSTQKPASAPAVTQTETPAPAVETPVEEIPAESDKYTPDEVIAIYRSSMEDAGITWDPSIKEFASWGTGFLFLKKGWIEANIQSEIESFRMGDTAGNPWTYYYLEVTGYDEDKVYITEWSCS